jgi:hypothetical protein
MLSSSIPARLEFQCGHAALVSLPRIKGETSTQRNERVALEKRNAQVRVCDFCAPRLEQVAQVLTVVPPPVEVVAAAPPAELVVFATAEPVASVTPIAEPAAFVEPSPEPVESLAAAREATPEPAVARAVPKVHATTAPPKASVASRRPPAAAESTNGFRSPGRRKPVPRPKAATSRSARVGLQRFEIRFEVERVLHAANIRDAVRQAELLGATEVLGVSLVGAA